MSSLFRAIRSLARTPGFAVVAIVTLALAIASIATLFTVVDAVLLKPLPFPDAERIIRIMRVQHSCTHCPIARAALADWQQQSTGAFAALGAFTGMNATLTGDGVAEQLSASRVTPEFWDVFKVAPLLGRTFTATDDKENRAVAVISYTFWQRRFAADPAVIGRTFTLNGESQQIIGVMPKGFAYPSADVWAPGALLAGAATDRDTSYLNVIARLRAGVSLDEARQMMTVVTAREAHDFPKQHEGLAADLTPLQERVTSTVRPALTVMFAASAMVLLIACANLANLMLARAQVRRRELAVRSALGASRGSLIWHLTAESAVIACIGSLLGLGLALIAIDMLPKLAPDLLPDYNPLAIDGGVVAFVVFVAGSALIAFGFAPAWRSTQLDPASSLQDEARGGAGSRFQTRSRAALVIGEVALSLVLLAGAALLIESSRRLANVDPGIDINRVLTASLTLPSMPNRLGESSDDWTVRQVAATTPRIDALLERLRAMPEIESVAFTDAVPLSGRGNTNSDVRVIGREYRGAGSIPISEWRFVSSDYFRTLGLKVLRGRAFSPEDSHGRGITTDVLVNETFARTFLADVDPIGQQLNVWDDKPKTIVGVVESARQWGLDREPSPEVYFPIYDCAVTTELEIVAKTRVAPALAAEPLRRVLREAAPDLPVTQVRTMTQVVSEGNNMRRFFSTLMIVFSAVALVLAMVGLYGLIAYSVAQRRIEIGVRMSLGADRSRVLRMILGQGLALVGGGLAFGILGALALSKVLGSLLYGVGPHDPLVLGAVAAVLLVTGGLACVVPALRASRVAPVEALRHD